MTTEEKRFDTATQDALDAFWNVIAQRYPEIRTGDMGPDEVFTMQAQAEQWVRWWLENNS